MNLTNIDFAATVVFVLLQLADVWTTNKGLSLGLLEGNQIIAFLMKHLGRFWVVAKLVVACLGAGYFLATGFHVVVWLMCLFYAWIVRKNLKLIKEAEGE